MSPGAEGHLVSRVMWGLGAMRHCPAAPDTGSCARHAGGRGPDAPWEWEPVLTAGQVDGGSWAPGGRGGSWALGGRGGSWAPGRRGLQFSSGRREHTARCRAHLALGWHWPPPRVTFHTLHHRLCLPLWAGQSQESRKASPWASLWAGLPHDDTEAPTTPGIGARKVMVCASPYPEVMWKQLCLPWSYCGCWGAHKPIQAGWHRARLLARSSLP